MTKAGQQRTSRKKPCFAWQREWQCRRGETAHVLTKANQDKKGKQKARVDKVLADAFITVARAVEELIADSQMMIAVLL